MPALPSIDDLPTGIESFAGQIDLARLLRPAFGLDAGCYRIVSCFGSCTLILQMTPSAANSRPTVAFGIALSINWLPKPFVFGS